MFSLLLLLIVFSWNYVEGINQDTFYRYADYLQKAVVDKNITEPCNTQLRAFLEGISAKDTWALEMLDANGRIPTGLMKGNNIDMGLYDECVALEHKLELYNEHVHTIKGKYCLSGLIIPLNLNTTISDGFFKRKNYAGGMVMPKGDMINGRASENLPEYALISLCIPSSCKPSDIFDFGLDSVCVTKDDNTLDTSDIACLVFLAVILWFMIVSTAYDVYLQKNGIKPLHPVLQAFSVYTNGQKILKVSNSQGQILCFNGMKVLSMLWVITGHRFSMTQAAGVVNPADTDRWMRNWYSPYILIAPLAVDTFLFVSGALLAYGFVKTMTKPNARFNIVLYYVHRYLRLTPALAALFFVQITIVRRIGSGPMYNAGMEYFNSNCRKYWWRLFLYIQNYFKFEDSCLPHTWYLSMDLQFFLISPLTLLPIIRYSKFMSKYGLPAITAISIACPMIIIYVYNVKYFSQDYYDLYYYVSHTRLAPWLIGISFGGFVLTNTDSKRNVFVANQIYNMAAWAVFFAVISILFFCHNDVAFNATRLKNTLYIALQRPIWAACLCWLSYACVNGHGGFINWFLTLPLFQPLSKITYCVYLVHMTALTFDLCSARTLTYFNDYTTVRIISADVIFSLAIGAFWTLAFESPIITIEKFIFGAGTKANAAPLNQNVDVENARVLNTLPPQNLEMKILVDNDAVGSSITKF